MPFESKFIKEKLTKQPIGHKSANIEFFGLDHKITSDFFVKMNYFHFLSICFLWPKQLDAVTSQTANRPQTADMGFLGLDH